MPRTILTAPIPTWPCHVAPAGPNQTSTYRILTYLVSPATPRQFPPILVLPAKTNLARRIPTYLVSPAVNEPDLANLRLASTAVPTLAGPCRTTSLRDFTCLACHIKPFTRRTSPLPIWPNHTCHANANLIGACQSALVPPCLPCLNSTGPAKSLHA